MENVSKTTTIRERVLAIERLGAFPQVAMRLLDAIGDERTNVSDLAEIIESDMALASKVLSLANSAFYAPKQQITTIHRSVVVIGFEELQLLTLGIGLSEIFDMSNVPEGFDMEGLWMHSMAVGWMSKNLATIAEGCFGTGSHGIRNTSRPRQIDPRRIFHRGTTKNNDSHEAGSPFSSGGGTDRNRSCRRRVLAGEKLGSSGNSSFRYPESSRRSTRFTARAVNGSYCNGRYSDEETGTGTRTRVRIGRCAWIRTIYRFDSDPIGKRIRHRAKEPAPLAGNMDFSVQPRRIIFV